MAIDRKVTVYCRGGNPCACDTIIKVMEEHPKACRFHMKYPHETPTMRFTYFWMSSNIRWSLYYDMIKLMAAVPGVVNIEYVGEPEKNYNVLWFLAVMGFLLGATNLVQINIYASIFCLVMVPVTFIWSAQFTTRSGKPDYIRIGRFIDKWYYLYLRIRKHV